MNNQEVEDQAQSERDERVELARAVWGLQNEDYYRGAPGEVRKLIQEASRAVDMGDFDSALTTLEKLDHPPEAVNYIYEKIHKLGKERQLMDREIPEMYLARGVGDLADKIRNFFESRDDISEDIMRKIIFNTDDFTRRLRSPSETNWRVVLDKLEEILKTFADDEIENNEQTQGIIDLTRMLREKMIEQLRGRETDPDQQIVNDDPEVAALKGDTVQLFEDTYKFMDIPPDQIVLSKFKKGPVTKEKLTEANTRLREAVEDQALSQEQVAKVVGEVEDSVMRDDTQDEKNWTIKVYDLRERRDKIFNLRSRQKDLPDVQEAFKNSSMADRNEFAVPTETPQPQDNFQEKEMKIAA